jgi:hypothetical protein
MQVRTEASREGGECEDEAKAAADCSTSGN